MGWSLFVGSLLALISCPLYCSRLSFCGSPTVLEHAELCALPEPSGIGLTLEEWERGKDFEVGFWGSWMESKGSAWPEDFKGRFSPATPLRSELTSNARLLERFPDSAASRVLVLDCGAGPVTGVGYTWGERSVTVMAVDPLAKEYNQLLRTKFDLAPPVWTQYAPVESLSKHFSASFYDIVHMRNALDHSADPLLGLGEMLYVARPGAPVFLSHARNVAMFEHKVGFHQWNLDCVDETFVIWQEESSKVDVQEHFRGKAVVECSLSGESVMAWLWKE